jgi:MarR family transcriptional regulator for hemolysin
MRSIWLPMDQDALLELRRELVFQLIESSRLLQAFVDERAKEFGTTRAQWGVLGRLRRQEGLTQVELAAQLGLQPISLVRLLDRLVEQKCVERRTDPHDRRANKLYLTEKGRRMIEELDPHGHRLRADVLESFSNEDVLQMREMLIAIKARLGALTSEAHDSATEPAA